MTAAFFAVGFNVGLIYGGWSRKYSFHDSWSVAVAFSAVQLAGYFVTHEFSVFVLFCNSVNEAAGSSTA